jgi:DNA-binding transcriptional ArsR family regulator
MVIRRLSDGEADAVFRALSDATRRDIVRRAIGEEQSISALATRYEMSFPAVHKHVTVLERAGLVSKNRRGKEQIVRADLATVRRAGLLLDEYEQLWRGRAERIADLLRDTPEITQPESAPPEPAQSEPAQPESAQPESAQPEPAQPEVLREEPNGKERS